MSTPAKHTPGPWEYLDIGEIVRADDPDATIAIMNFGTGAGSNAECEANARLIAATPELLERLQAIIDWADLALDNPDEFNAHGVKNLTGPIFDEARAVLALATSVLEREG